MNIQVTAHGRKRIKKRLRVYGDKIYIFCGKVLVTVLDLPLMYRGAVNSLIRRRGK